MKPQKTRGAISLILIAALAPWSSAQPVAESLTLSQRAVSLYQSGQLEEALPLYRRLAKSSPQNAAVLKDLLWVLWKSKRLAEAAPVARQLAALEPNDIEAFNFLGQAEEADGQRQSALAAYARLDQLEPDRLDVLRAMARLLTDLKRYTEAAQVYGRITARYPEADDIFPALAAVQYLLNDFAASAQNWAAALRKDPENRAYRFSEAQALYYSGRRSEALDRMRRLVHDDPEHWKAQDFLTDDALARADFPEAQRLIITRLPRLRTEDEFRVLQLAQIHQHLGAWDESIKALQRYLQKHPDHGQARLLLGDALLRLRHPAEAAAAYESVVAKNPSSLRALSGLAESRVLLNDFAGALTVVRRARAIDPTDPYLALREARYLYGLGRREESRKILMTLLEPSLLPPLPVLLYHGLTTLKDDPLLAHPVHLSAAAFESQMEGLSGAGYQAITIEQAALWLAGKGTLPPRPVLITFDDGRADSFAQGDPVLKKFGLQAAMFLQTNDIDQSLPVNASWTQLQAYAATGRWEFQAHSDRGHERITVDAAGHTGLYLPNRQWLADEKRIETAEEWTRRVSKDMTRSREKILRSIGTAPIAFSWPEGDFGQDAIPNAPDAAPRGLAAMRGTFTLGFQQDSYGLNLRTRDPALLTRLVPGQNWTGADLLRHIQLSNPVFMATRQLLQQAVWQARVPEANDWLAEMAKLGAPQSILLSDGARIHLAAGDPAGAMKLVLQSLALEDDPETRALLAELQKGRRQAWSAEFSYLDDNQGRESLMLDQTLGAWEVGPALLSLRQHSRRMKETGTDTLSDNGAGVEAVLPLGPLHSFTAEVQAHVVDHNASDSISAKGRIQSKWSQGWSSEISGGQDAFDTAGAVSAGILDRFGRLQLLWNSEELWRVTSAARFGSPSDGNQRITGTMEIERAIFGSRLGAVGRAVYDDTQALSPHYYSPNQLQTYQMGLAMTAGSARPWQFKVRYLPGVGHEIPTDWEVVHDVEASLPVICGRATLMPLFSYRKTPSYRSNYYALFLILPL